MTDVSYKEKYTAFLEATGMYGKDVSDLVEDDLLKSHDMGLFINHKFDEMRDELHNLKHFKETISELIRMFGGSVMGEFLNFVHSQSDDEDEESE